MLRCVAICFAFALVVAPPAHAGMFGWVDSLFTFREDQKERVAPKRRLPPIEVPVPYYPEKEATGWSNHYTREDLQATDYMPSSGSKVMRPAEQRDDAYWQRMQARMDARARENQQRVYIGEPGTGPGMQEPYNGRMGTGTRIGEPVNDWRSPAPQGYGMVPRPGDFDYVAPRDDRGLWEEENRWAGSAAAQPPTRVAPVQPDARWRNDPRYVEFNERGQVTGYKVQGGDTLSGIAEQKAIYDNWKLWPLIYSANRSAIGGSPNNLKVNQKLGIPRDYTSAQAREAEQKAGRR